MKTSTPVIAFAIAIGSGMGSAQSLEWQEAQIVGEPQPFVVDSAMIWDRTIGNGCAIRFGGAEGITPFGGTWMFARGVWLKLNLSTEPDPRSGHVFTADLNHGGGLLFGGAQTGGMASDTWRWDGEGWTQLEPLHPPPARSNSSMAFDPVRNRYVMFGGRAAHRRVADTWEWDGSDWVEIQTAAMPSPRENHAMAYDLISGRILLYGGRSDLRVESDLWAYDGTNWERWTPRGPLPGPRADHQLVYDWATHQVLVVGGDSGRGPAREVFGYAVGHWHARGEAPVTAPNDGLAVSSDAVNGGFLAFGGEDSAGSLNGTTWSFGASGWSMVQEPPMPSKRSGACAAWDDQAGAVVLLGGGFDFVDFGTVWHIREGVWQRQSEPGPPARRDSEVVWDARSQQLVVFGGRRSNAPLDDTWVREDGVWREVFSANTSQPEARHGHAMAYDPVRERVVLFGGTGIGGRRYADTWEWDGTNWTETTPIGGPVGRFGASMAWDGRRQEVVCHGGFTVGVLGDTWSYDGNRWRLVSANGPRRVGHTLVWDEERDVLITVGGMDQTLLGTREVLEFHGTDWISVSTGVEPEARRDHAAAYDRRAAEVVVFGGANPWPMGDLWLLRNRERAFVVAFGSACGGAQGAPALDFSQALWLGESGWFSIRWPLPGAVTHLIYGEDNRSWRARSLPFDLGPWGSPGCQLLVRPDWGRTASVTGGVAEYAIPVPNNPALVGMAVYLQGVVRDPSMPRGWSLTQGLHAVVGTR